ncbi:BRCT domain-containing protein [Enterococcus termitis]
MNIEGEYVVFSGELLCMSRKQAKALIYSLGGYNQQTVNKKTTLLVTGLFKTHFFSKEIQYKEKEKQKV